MLRRCCCRQRRGAPTRFQSRCGCSSDVAAPVRPVLHTMLPSSQERVLQTMLPSSMARVLQTVFSSPRAVPQTLAPVLSPQRTLRQLRPPQSVPQTTF